MEDNHIYSLDINEEITIIKRNYFFYRDMFEGDAQYPYGADDYNRWRYWHRLYNKYCAT